MVRMVVWLVVSIFHGEDGCLVANLSWLHGWLENIFKYAQTHHRLVAYLYWLKGHCLTIGKWCSVGISNGRMQYVKKGVTAISFNLKYSKADAGAGTVPLMTICLVFILSLLLHTIWALCFYNRDAAAAGPAVEDVIRVSKNIKFRYFSYNQVFSVGLKKPYRKGYSINNKNICKEKNCFKNSLSLRIFFLFNDDISWRK